MTIITLGEILSWSHEKLQEKMKDETFRKAWMKMVDDYQSSRTIDEDLPPALSYNDALLQSPWMIPKEGIPALYKEAWVTPQLANVLVFNPFKDDNPEIPLPLPQKMFCLETGDDPEQDNIDFKKPKVKVEEGSKKESRNDWNK